MIPFIGSIDLYVINELLRTTNTALLCAILMLIIFAPPENY